jgi:hypothetical protein
MSGPNASPKCDGCGAGLPVAEAGMVLTCGYCGAQIRVPEPPRAPEPPAAPGGPVKQIVIAPGRSIEIHGNRIELRGNFRSVADIEEELADKRRAEAERLRTARIYAMVLSVFFVLVLGAILLATR